MLIRNGLAAPNQVLKDGDHVSAIDSCHPADEPLVYYSTACLRVRNLLCV